MLWDLISINPFTYSMQSFMECLIYNVMSLWKKVLEDTLAGMHFLFPRSTMEMWNRDD